MAHGHEAHTRRTHNKKTVHISPADRLLHHRPLLSDVLGGQHLLLLMLLVHCGAALRKRLRSRAAARVAAVRLRQEILHQKLRHLGVQLHHALAYRLLVRHQALHLRCMSRDVSGGGAAAAHQLALRFVHLKELLASMSRARTAMRATQRPGTHLVVALPAVRLELAHVVQLSVHRLQLRLARAARRLVVLVQHLLPAQLLQQLRLGLLVTQLHFFNVALPERVPLLLARKLVGQLLLLQLDGLKLRLVLAPDGVDLQQCQQSDSQ
jgi:hypothetical protein